MTSLLPSALDVDIEHHIRQYEDGSRLQQLFEGHGLAPHAIKFVAAEWAATYATSQQLKVSNSPLQTWGTGTYASPIVFPLSSVLFGRIGLVTNFDPRGWRVFDCTDPFAQVAYLRWAQAQSVFPELVLSVHSTGVNHILRNKFREDFEIDCVLFRPDQEAELHTDRDEHIWMAVTDWAAGGGIDPGFSSRLGRARFTVLVDEEFDVLTRDFGLPVRAAGRKIESTTQGFLDNSCLPVSRARRDPTLGHTIVEKFSTGGYVHVYVEP